MEKKIRNAPGSRAILYARVSTEEQAGKDHFSIEAQLHEMRDLVQEKGWEIVGEFIDEGESGTKRDRPQLLAALKVAEKKGCDILITHELSRLSRSVYHTLDIFDKLGALHVGYISVKDPEFDFADPSKRFFLTIMAAINEYYIHLLRQHTSKSKRERSRQGLYNASIAPLGYALAGEAKKPSLINEQEALIIRFIYESYASGRYSDQDVADLTRQRGYHNRRGRNFSKDNISEILTNVYYVGKVSYTAAKGEPEIYDGQHEALISTDLWEKCQNIRASRSHMSRAVQKKFRNYLLSMLAVCDVCGRTLRAQGARAGSYYREMSYERGYVDCPHQKTGVRAEVLERQVHELIKYIQLPEDWVQEVADHAGDEEELARLNRQRDRLEAERRRLQQMRIEGDFDDNLDAYREEMDRIRRESAALPTYDQIESLKVTAKTIGDLYQIWEHAEPGDQRDLLRLMLREVRVDVPNGRITSIAPLAVFVPIFRKLPTLFEYDFGHFLPLWENISLPSVKPLPELIQLPADSPTLPFFADNPLIPQGEIRNTPAIADALKLVGRKDILRVAQVMRDVSAAFPMDFRKWQGAQGYVLTLEQLLDQPEASFDVVVSQFALWKSNQENLEALLSKLAPGGVWYFNELLPADSPSHWLYRAMPAAWEWAKKNTWSLQTLYNRLQAECESVKIKRHVYSQSVSIEAAQDILKRNPKIVRNVSAEALSPALARLGDLTPLASEFTIIEGWAKRKKI
jgi:DNA invertase Pin-like site-specific DNA recombinase